MGRRFTIYKQNVISSSFRCDITSVQGDITSPQDDII